MQWETEEPAVYSAEAEPVMAEAEPVMAEEEPVMMAEEEPVMEQAPSLAAEEPVSGEEVMVEEAAAEESHAEVLGETGRSRIPQGEAMLAAGHAAYARKDWPAAMKAFQQSADAGNAEGAWELSLMHAHGKTGVVDKEKAKKWLMIAADGGAVQAMMFLAQMSTFGRGGYKKDESMALDLLKRAADQGNAHATHQVGVRYLYAVGVEQDLDKAIEHFDKAIELGSTDAVKDLKIAKKNKSLGVVRSIKKGLSKRVLGRSRTKKNTVESSLRIKAASAPLKSPSSSRQTSRQSTPAEEPYAEVLGETEDVDSEGVMVEGVVEGVVAAEGKALTNETLRDWVERWCSGNRKGLPPISTWNTSQVTDMNNLFAGKPHGYEHNSKFNDDISAWDTSNVTDMSRMFNGAKSFNQPLGDWRVDKVTNMHEMFGCALAFNQPLNDWRVENVTNMHAMFYGALSFNQPLNDWRVDNVTNMRKMFHSASAFNQPLGKWRVDNVMSMYAMFRRARSFNQPLGDWRLRADCNTSRMLKYTNFRNSRPVGGSSSIKSQMEEPSAVS